MRIKGHPGARQLPRANPSHPCVFPPSECLHENWAQAPNSSLELLPHSASPYTDPKPPGAVPTDQKTPKPQITLGLAASPDRGGRFRITNLPPQSPGGDKGQAKGKAQRSQPSQGGDAVTVPVSPAGPRGGTAWPGPVPVPGFALARRDCGSSPEHRLFLSFKFRVQRERRGGRKKKKKRL